ncbi:MAG: type II toxin-antitoxin system VapC family toxin [Acidobacteria bacterium]|nr:type II toxin-antitoxin system VapC family toxin [Acidobacteriota bacterium]
MPRYMLDTNTVSHIIKGQPAAVRENLQRIPMDQVCISAITEAELLLGLAQKPAATRLAEVVAQFLLHVEILPWDSIAAKSYAHFASATFAQGKPLSALDILIASHAIAAAATLVTSDRSFYRLKLRPPLIDWTMR